MPLVTFYIIVSPYQRANISIKHIRFPLHDAILTKNIMIVSKGDGKK
jgi:hypothetical protein